MKQLQVVLITTLIVLSYQRDNAISSKQKLKKSGRSKDFIRVRIDKTRHATQPIFIPINIEKRAIVPFQYKTNSNPGGFPDNIQVVECNKTCRGHELDMNAVPIQRSIHYLKKEKNAYVLTEEIVTVGCTCIYPIVIEKNT